MEFTYDWIHMNTPGVYMIQNTCTGKVYIGSSKSVRRRFWEWKSRLTTNTSENRIIQEDYNKYGSVAFLFKVLLLCEESLCKYYEQFYIDKYISYSYNIATNSSNMSGYKHTDETRKLLVAASARGKKNLTGLLNCSKEKRYNKKHSESLSKTFSRILQTKCNADINDESVKKALANRAKIYPGFISPDGTVYRNILNLAGFCRQYGLNNRRMGEMSCGKIKEHKGWKAIT